MAILNKTFVESLESKDKEIVYWDDKLTGFGVKVTPTGKKVYIFKYRDNNGKQRKITIGSHGKYACNEAKDEAKEIQKSANKGLDIEKDLVIEKRKLELTLNELLEIYIERHAKQHKKTWKYNEQYYNRYLRKVFGDRKLSDISQTEVATLHSQIGKKSGHSMANQIVTLLGMLYNKAVEWEYFNNRIPTLYIKKFKEKSRDRFLQAHELPIFLQAVDEEEPLFKDFFYILLLTGQRKTNVLEMQWKDISFESSSWRIPETKNGEPLVVPLIESVIEILKGRKEKSKHTKWVFESETSESGRLVDPKKAWARIRNRSRIEDLNMHDLRRTMGSYQTILGSSSFIVAKSLGHKSIKSTEIYARLNIDPVRESMEKASSAILNIKKENNDG
jgi:integrase